MEDREFELKGAELRLKEREVALKERETSSRWKNPLVLAIFAAALGLFGNVVVSLINNNAAERTEHIRAQSNLIVQTIKTNGDTDAACKNLTFFVKTGLLDDPKSAIHGVCAETKDGIPTLPSESSRGAAAVSPTNSFTILDADSNQPIEGAQLQIFFGGSLLMGSIVTDAKGYAPFNQPFFTSSTVKVSKSGYESVTMTPMPFSSSPQIIWLRRVKSSGA